MDRAAPLVSVIINNFNYARFLTDAVESALTQSWPALEVIVVDDGSTDASAEVLERWAGRIIPVLKENGGQASALNEGWARARGDVVVLLDADDVLLPGAVARAVAAMTPATAAVWAPVSMADPDLAPLGRTLPADALPAGDLADDLLAGMPLPAPPTSGIALHRPVADVLFPIPEHEWRISADAYLVTLLPLVGNVAALRQPAALYRVHGGNRWVLGERLPVARLHEQLRMDRQREAALRALATCRGRAMAPDWAHRHAEVLQARLASLRLEPSAHPEPADRAVRLGTSGAYAALRTRTWPARKRLLFALWFMLAAVLPGRTAIPVIEAAYRARPRPWLARLILGDTRPRKD